MSYEPRPLTGIICYQLFKTKDKMTSEEFSSLYGVYLLSTIWKMNGTKRRQTVLVPLRGLFVINSSGRRPSMQCLRSRPLTGIICYQHEP